MKIKQRLTFNRMRSSAMMLTMAAMLVPGLLVAEDLTIPWHSVAGGGIMYSSGGDFRLGSTIGQLDAAAMTGGGFTLNGGFWAGVPFCACRSDFNVDGKRDAFDVQQLVECYTRPGIPCDCADVNSDGMVNPVDIDAFVADMLSGTSCD